MAQSYQKGLRTQMIKTLNLEQAESAARVSGVSKIGPL